MAATRPIRPVTNERLLKDAAVLDAKSEERMREAWVAAVMRENDLKRLRLIGGSAGSRVSGYR
jgi:hypothetical protein